MTNESELDSLRKDFDEKQKGIEFIAEQRNKLQQTLKSTQEELEQKKLLIKHWRAVAEHNEQIIHSIEDVGVEEIKELIRLKRTVSHIKNHIPFLQRPRDLWPSQEGHDLQLAQAFVTLLKEKIGGK